MGSRTRCLGLVLAMMAVNSIYMQTLRQQELIRLLDAEEATIEEIETDPLVEIRPELDQVDPRSR
ncbi:MAG: hypothetical protein HC818_03820 [Synechococcaceae cyanobacterium RM1_1_27]|nr:hypothetical protein [Synechococcaceae cyanobacterium SM2_3_2]NJO85847.1 hypothetical protein [Synechococcaceae cyanobacterium RM1_1_27]